MTHVGFRYTIEWNNPYTSPDNNSPRIKNEFFETTDQRRIRMEQGEPPVPKWFSDLHVR